MDKAKEIQKAILVHIVTLRKKADLSQAEMAEKMKITQSSYARFETGKSKTDLSELISFCQSLNISLKEFFDVPEPKNSAEITIKIIDGSKEELIRVLKNSGNTAKSIFLGFFCFFFV